VASFWIDITERKRLEEQFLQAQRMEAVGRLAGGIAHDFNNLLTVINGFAELVLGGLRPDDPATGMVGEIRKAGERAASLTRQLLAYGRKTILMPKVFDPNEAVRAAAPMLRRVLGENVELKLDLPPDVGPVN
jgi:two-component system, cell cycle sensor histidine kinase and response regulator CckA